MFVRLTPGSLTKWLPWVRGVNAQGDTYVPSSCLIASRDTIGTRTYIYIHTCIRNIIGIYPECHGHVFPILGIIGKQFGILVVE